MRAPLAERLRATAKRHYPATARLLKEAADTIEHLEAEIDYLAGQDDETCELCGTTRNVHTRSTGMNVCGRCSLLEEDLPEVKG